MELFCRKIAVEHGGAWLFWGLGNYLVLEIGPFLVLGLALKKTATDLARPIWFVPCLQQSGCHLFGG